MRYLRFVMSCSAVSTALLFSGAAFSQESASAFPSKPVTFVIPSLAGGPTDVEARIYSNKLTELLKQPVLFDYKPGGGFRIARSATRVSATAPTSSPAAGCSRSSRSPGSIAARPKRPRQASPCRPARS